MICNTGEVKDARDIFMKTKLITVRLSCELIQALNRYVKEVNEQERIKNVSRNALISFIIEKAVARNKK